MKVKRNLKRLLSVAAAVATVATGTALMGMAADGGVTEGTPATPDHPYYAWAAMTDIKGVNLIGDDLTLPSPNVKNEDGSISLSLQGNPIFKYTESKTIDLNANPYLYWSVNQAASSKFSFGLSVDNNTSYSRVTGLDDQGVPLFEQLNNVPVSKRFTGSETGCINLKELVGSDTLTLQGICAAGTRVKPTINYLFVGPAPSTEPSVTEPSETEPSETEPSDVPGPSTGAAATPDQPYHAWAADSKPANVTVGTNLLDSAKGDSSDKVTFNADGSLSYSWNGWATYSLKGFTVNLEENPYLYWSIEQGNAGSSGTFALYASAPWLTSRSKALTADGTLFTGDGNGVPGADYITGNETGCFNMYEWYKAVNAEGLSAKAISELKFYGTGTADITINYMFFGPAPSTEPSVTEPSETEPSVTEPSETEPSETEPSETEPSETEPSETKPTTPVETKTSIISFNPEDWTTDVPENMEIVKGADGSLEIANTNGAWPAAGYVLPNGGITFDPAKTTLNYDFTVGPSTNIILFFNGSTPEEYKDGQHKTITHKIDGAELNGDDITGNGASFKGSFSLNDPDYFPSACYNEDGTMTLTGVRIFAAGAAGSKVVVRELSIETEGAPTEPTDTQPTDTEPTETEPTDTQPTDTQPTETEPTGTDSSVNTTASSATTATTASTQKDNPKTGDDLTMISLGLALMAVSAGALFFFRRKQA